MYTHIKDNHIRLLHFGLSEASEGCRLTCPPGCQQHGEEEGEVQFEVPEEDVDAELEIVEDEYLEAPYTSILMSTASGDGSVARKRNILLIACDTLKPNSISRAMRS